ncbi:MAG: tRNA preQ1(34) S-adenosylmethionine ribosyltransferase-isomerase QueA [Rhizobiales bacterium]|nr:tRNA preQ1(34) S-adenosylmethionine ribosyltransferase-isomerase QueA [Hyphomicrobiales bacterium]
MHIDQFDFDLPPELIALAPAEPRDGARLLAIPATGPFADRTVRDLPDLLAPGDLLVMNDTRVIPAALEGVRQRPGAPSVAITCNLHKRVDAARWRAFARPGKRLAVSDRVDFGAPQCGDGGEALSAVVEEKGEAGEIVLCFAAEGAELDAAIARVGVMPLPPYIASRRPAGPGDATNYQTIYATHDGAVAAPTAGLHFTPELMSRLAERGIGRTFVTLHVGAGTFLPVKSERIEEHRMHAEWGSIGQETVAAIAETRARGGRVVAVGTTSLRLLESAAGEDGAVRPFAGETAIFITPGYRFRATDLLMTNFHLPRSTLFMLVAAAAGLERMRAAYAHAIAGRYRFYSYGDASLIEIAGRTATRETIR